MSTPSARNILVTVFGDALVPYGQAVSVASIAALVEGLGINERLVRTSLTRLVRERLLENRPHGRRSFYSVHPDALELFRAAEARIYHRVDRPWDGAWTLAVIDPTAGTTRQRAALRRELGWLGFGTVAPNVLGSPVASPESVEQAMRHVGPGAAAVVTRSRVWNGQALIGDDELAARCAPLDDLATGYRAIVEEFGPLVDRPRDGPNQPGEAFALRISLIARWRRAVLADPALPRELLPDGWIGDAAYAVTGRLYRRLFASSEQFVRATCETVDGGLGSIAIDRLPRFADLETGDT